MFGSSWKILDAEDNEDPVFVLGLCFLVRNEISLQGNIVFHCVCVGNM